MKISWLLKLLKNKQNNSNKGVTLTELLVASTISMVVIGGAGYALMESQKSSRAASTQVDARTEVNRTLTFITDEIKGARTIANTSDQTADGYLYTSPRDPDSKLPSNFAPTGTNIKVVLALQVPHPTNDTANLDVIYYVKDSEAPWIGPKVIYRWGPNFDAKGGYSTATVDNPASWQHEALIDQIHNDVASTNTCLTSDIKVTASDAGFGVCIDSNTRRSVNVLISRVKDQKDYKGNSSNAKTKSNSVYTGELKAFARGDSKYTGYTGNMGLTTTTATGSPNSTQASKSIRLKRLEASYACSNSNPAAIVTEVTVTKSDSSQTVYEWRNENGGYAINKTDNSLVKDIPFDRSAGDTATYTSKYIPTGAQCSMNSNASVTLSSSVATTSPTSTEKVQELRDNRTLNSSNLADGRMMNSKYTNGNPTPTQRTVKEILQDSQLYNTSNNTITIPQQVDGQTYERFIYAFEMGPASGETGFHEAGFDYQDNLILVSIAD